tara:strand:- start:482 stop:1450 length:969 start_codon:yes stop_codon:yes gene_type:complete
MRKIESISSGRVSKNKENIISLLKNKNKSLPTKYLYDDLGSKLFEEICDTEEYYLTRTEKEIIDQYSMDIIDTSCAQEIFELGSGSSKKTKRLILNALENNDNVTYFSFDISAKALKMSYNQLRKISNKLHIRLIKGDFNNDLNILSSSKKNRLYMFLGSTIGNFDDIQAKKFLSDISNIMKENDSFLLGVDRVKDEKIIKMAYNDKKGITGKFNKNILNVVNKEYKLNFNENNFAHNAKYNVQKSQIEMYLEAITQQSIILPNKESLDINIGDKILTEISRKFSEKTLKMLFNKSALVPIKCYTDKKNYFSLYLLKAKKYF